MIVHINLVQLVKYYLKKGITLLIIKVSKWHNYNFGANYPFNVVFIVKYTDWNKQTNKNITNTF